MTGTPCSPRTRMSSARGTPASSAPFPTPHRLRRTGSAAHRTRSSALNAALSSSATCSRGSSTATVIVSRGVDVRIVGRMRIGNQRARLVPRPPKLETKLPAAERFVDGHASSKPRQTEAKRAGILKDLGALRKRGLEPPRPFGHWNLNPARLPVPPLPRGGSMYADRGGVSSSRQAGEGGPKSFRTSASCAGIRAAGRLPKR